MILIKKNLTQSKLGKLPFSGESLRKGAVKSRRHGFALVVTLTLMVLLTILALGLLSLSTISLRASSSAQLQASARANAMLAMQLAIGQLQKEAGVDQRISATASILDNDPSSPEPDGTTEPDWTGIWKTGNKETEEQRTESITSDPAESATWLVSNPDPTTSLTPLTWKGDENNSVVIANIGQGTNKRSVRAPLVETSNRPGNTVTGKFAYWTSDEGVKANASLIDPTFGSDDIALSQLHYWAPQANAMHEILPMATTGTDFREAPLESIQKLSTTKSVELLDIVKDDFIANENWSDYTVHSRGVIADVRNGGLKKDLTAAFEDSSDDYGQFQDLLDNYGSGLSMVYRQKGATGGNYGQPDGMLWHSLFYHYNSYKESAVSPSDFVGKNTVIPTGIGDPANSLPHTVSARINSFRPSGTGSGYTIKSGGIAPIIIAYRLDIAISSYQVENKWKLRLHYYPQLVLYNPYSVRINSANLQIARNCNAFNRQEIQGNIGGETLPPTKLHPLVNGRLRLQTKAGSSDLIEPGETRVYALSADAQMQIANDAINFRELNSDPGMSPDYSQWADIQAFAGTEDPNASVSLTLSSNRLGMNAVDTFIDPRPLKWPETDGGSRYGNGAPRDAFAEKTLFPSIPISSMESAPRRLIGLYVRQKGLTPASTGTKVYSNNTNKVPILMGNAGTLNIIEDTHAAQWSEVYLTPLGSVYQNGQAEVMMEPTGGGSSWQTTWGERSTGAAGPMTRKILRDVPTQPMLSLGQFMHTPAYAFNSSGQFQTLSIGSMPIGGSYSSPIVPTDQTSIVTNNGSRKRLDDSFLANEALFDRFFLSTVPPETLAGGTDYPEYWDNFNVANSGSEIEEETTLLNSRIKLYSNSGNKTKLEDLRDMEKAAANLMIDGAFNVNSTSVGAWKALLASLAGNQLHIFNATSQSAVTLTPPANTAPIPRFWNATATGTWNSPWDGLRALDETEVNDLAENIVAEVKLRGPFLSMADFLNRRLGPNGELTRVGALQAAIDKTTGLNSAAKSMGVNSTVDPTTNEIPKMFTENLSDGAGSPMSTATGMPGFLMQQDLVQAFSPVMTVRSDTFVIRCYGEASNASTTVRAWCEAVVQRSPDFIDSANDPAAETPLDQLNSEPNKILGRKFKIQSVRWLSLNEI